MTPSDSIAQANRALPTEVPTACGERINTARYLTCLRGCDQPTRYATAALIRAAREQGGR